MSEQLATVVAALDSERQAQWAAIAEVAALVIVGFLATVAAAVILVVDNDANQWWWLGVGLAAALTFISAARLFPMVGRYRATPVRGDTA